MKKRAPFQLRSGNKPSPAKLLGVLSGKTKFKDSKVGKAINPEGKKVSITIGDKKFGDTKVGKFLKGFGPRKKAAVPPKIEPKKVKQIKPTLLPDKGEFKNAPAPKPKSTKTSYRQAFDAMIEHPTGGTREDKFGNIYENTPKGFADFKKAAKAYNKSKSTKPKTTFKKKGK